MRSERRAVNLLRNVYKRKGFMEWDFAGFYEPTLEMQEKGHFDGLGILLKCSYCGYVTQVMTDTCKNCGKIDKTLIGIRPLNKRRKNG